MDVDEFTAKQLKQNQRTGWGISHVAVTFGSGSPSIAGEELLLEPDRSCKGEEGEESELSGVEKIGLRVGLGVLELSPASSYGMGGIILISKDPEYFELLYACVVICFSTLTTLRVYCSIVYICIRSLPTTLETTYVTCCDQHAGLIAVHA
jgi:hypothetical protein